MTQIKVQNKFGPVISMGLSIVVDKQNQYQNQQYSQISHPQQLQTYQTQNVNQYHQIPQQATYKGMNQNPYQITKPPLYNYNNKILANPSIPYTNNLQSTDSTKVYKEQQVHIYKSQANNGVYTQGNKGPIPRTVNAQDMMYNQQMKRPFTVLVPYERRN